MILEEDHSNSPQGKKRPRKKKVQSPVVNSEVRRSSRVRERSNGFKPSGCMVINYLGCKVDPPTLFVDTLQAIGINMCQVSPEEVDQTCMNKKKKPKLIAKKKGKKVDSKDGAKDEEGPSKEKKTD